MRDLGRPPRAFLRDHSSVPCATRLLYDAPPPSRHLPVSPFVRTATVYAHIRAAARTSPLRHDASHATPARPCIIASRGVVPPRHAHCPRPLVRPVGGRAPARPPAHIPTILDSVTIPHDCIPATARVRVSADRYDILTFVAEDTSHTELWTVGDIDGHPLFAIDYVLLQLNACPLNDLTLTNVEAFIRVNSQLSSHILSGWSYLNRLTFVGCSYISAWLSLLRAGALPALDLLVLSHSNYDLDALSWINPICG
ncbi:uncharacterized protein B0H18DRAFT_1214563 [Fomitopsis serialis]|uniref:uncharacterized protein n=1 Tax=Fomitopsis serialis TaxID=139415 RepID=UPI002007885C|nr:uncharacterized protein B0H18DRAFT_1214563 [Neoantrodia serialis]KAH9917561.1 hypothetical protein B0H18DRAFT_1214563 [Neoantrodia serialis]